MTGVLIASVMVCVCGGGLLCLETGGKMEEKKKNFKNSLCVGRHCGGGLNWPA